MTNRQSSKRRIHFIANCVYGTHLAGGDIHFFEMARAAAEAGYDVNFFGGFALQQHIAAVEHAFRCFHAKLLVISRFTWK